MDNINWGGNKSKIKPAQVREKKITCCPIQVDRHFTRLSKNVRFSFSRAIEHFFFFCLENFSVSQNSLEFPMPLTLLYLSTSLITIQNNTFIIFLFASPMTAAPSPYPHPLQPHVSSWGLGFCLLSSELYPQHLEQGLLYGEALINTCGTDWSPML